MIHTASEVKKKYQQESGEVPAIIRLTTSFGGVLGTMAGVVQFENPKNIYF